MNNYSIKIAEKQQITSLTDMPKLLGKEKFIVKQFLQIRFGFILHKIPCLYVQAERIVFQEGVILFNSHKWVRRSYLFFNKSLISVNKVWSAVSVGGATPFSSLRFRELIPLTNRKIINANNRKFIATVTKFP